MKTKTIKQLNEQWCRISKFVKARGKFIEYFETFARYCNNMGDYNGDTPYFNGHEFMYNDRNNAPVPYEIYTKPRCYETDK